MRVAKMKISNKISYSFEDLVLLPSETPIDSRSEIPIDGFRIMVAPMPDVVGRSFIRAASELEARKRPFVCIPRFGIDSGERHALAELCSKVAVPMFYSIGLEEPGELEYALSNEFNVLVDVANGYLPRVAKFASGIHNVSHLMVGNVVTLDGALALYNIGVTHIRVGIGSGASCSTKFASGFHRGQLTAVMDCSDHNLGNSSQKRWATVSDGGIEFAGDIVKSFGMGATHVMAGWIFSHVAEAENRVQGLDKYQGLSSLKDIGGYVEGIKRDIYGIPAVPLGDFVDSIWDGIQSGVSMSGYTNLFDFIGNGVFERKARR